MATSLENAMATFPDTIAPSAPPPDPAPDQTPAAVRLWLLRHGERCDEIDASERREVEQAYEAERGLRRRRDDPFLTPRGVEQARRAGEAMRALGVRLAGVYSSPYRRTMQTAAGFVRGYADGGDADGAAPAALPPIVAVDALGACAAHAQRRGVQRLRDSGCFDDLPELLALCGADAPFADPAAAANDAGGATRVGAASRTSRARARRSRCRSRAPRATARRAA